MLTLTSTLTNYKLDLVRRTKEKLRVFGTNFAANLGPWMDTSEVPKAWGGSSKANAFDALLRGGHGDVAVDDFADCEDDD